jgi:hypothetical protein
MRKIIVLAVVLLAALAFFVRRHLHDAIDPAAFLPADTVIYTDQHQPAARGQRFLASPLGKAITSIDLPGLLHDLGAPMDVQTDVERMLGDFREFTGNKITAELLGERFVVAMLPRRDWMGEPGVLPDPRQRLVLLCKPRHGATAIDLLSSIYSGDLKIETVPYGKYSLKRFKNDELSFVVCAADGWLVAAFEERALRESLDIFDAGKGSLADSEKFRKITADLSRGEQIVYLRLDGLASFAKDALAGMPAKDRDALAGLFDVEPGFDGFAYGSWVDNSIVEQRILISLVPDRVSAAARKFLAAPPQKDAILPYLRDNLLLYSYTGATDWSALGELSAEYRAMVEDFSGHSTGELQQMLGDGASRLFVRKDENSQTLPLPLVNFCVAAAAPEKLDETVSSLLAKAGIDMSKGKFQDAAYQVWSKAPEKNLRLYSALWHGQWCLGNSPDFFKEIIAPSPEAASLFSAKDFKTIDSGINHPVQSLLYARVDQSLDLLHDICAGLATILAVKDKELSTKAKLINERLIFPVFAGMKMYKRSLSRGLVEDNMLKVDVRTSILPPESK